LVCSASHSLALPSCIACRMPHATCNMPHADAVAVAVADAVTVDPMPIIGQLQCLLHCCCCHCWLTVAHTYTCVNVCVWVC